MQMNCLPNISEIYIKYGLKYKKNHLADPLGKLTAFSHTPSWT